MVSFTPRPLYPRKKNSGRNTSVRKLDRPQSRPGRGGRPLKKYEGESNENRKNFFKFNLLNESGTQLYHFST
jgi:hypothetical protein